MILGIDHLAIAVAEPDEAIDALGALLGLVPGGGGRHLAWGTRNRLLWLGDAFIELCTVDDPALAQRSWLGRPTIRALSNGPGAICWGLSSDDLDADRALLNARGGRLGQPSAGERRRPDGRIVRWRLALPPEVDLQRPFLIEHDATAAEWTPADRAERASRPGRLLAIELPVASIQGLAPGTGGPIRIGDQAVRLAGPSAAVTIRIGGLPSVGASTLLGCHWVVD